MFPILATFLVATMEGTEMMAILVGVGFARLRACSVSVFAKA